MAILNEEQKKILAEIEDAREAYEDFEQKLSQEIADRKWVAKKHLRDLVRKARSARVPFRQVGFALGTSDHRTIKDLEADRRRDIG